ncbi:unnamed protein product [Auanema sp. JU1783]|nr:unnamed protein product [Auanema sp. JU1783]
MKFVAILCLSLFVATQAVPRFTRASELDVPSNVQNRSISIKGQFLCGTKPFDNVKIRIYRDYQKDKADDLAQLVSSKKAFAGMFQLDGNTARFPPTQTEFRPYVTVHHNCGLDEKTTANQGFKRWHFIIPEEYVTVGLRPIKKYDLGIINLQVLYPGEAHDKKFNMLDQ